jgi:hypothetical protein
VCDECCLRLGRRAAAQREQQKCQNLPARHET